MGVCESAGNKASSALDSAKNAVKGILNDETQFANYSESAFDKYDTDKSGYIEQSELKNVIDELASKLKQDTNISEDVVKKALEYIDADKDGKISKEEFTKTSRVKLLEAIK